MFMPKLSKFSADKIANETRENQCLYQEVVSQIDKLEISQLAQTILTTNINKLPSSM